MITGTINGKCEITGRLGLCVIGNDESGKLFCINEKYFDKLPKDKRLFYGGMIEKKRCKAILYRRNISIKCTKKAVLFGYCLQHIKRDFILTKKNG